MSKSEKSALDIGAIQDIAFEVYENAVVAKYGPTEIHMHQTAEDNFVVSFISPRTVDGETPSLYTIEDGRGSLTVSLSANAIRSLHHITSLLGQYGILYTDARHVKDTMNPDK